MSAMTPEKLYALLPAIHRLRDAAQGEPLKALLALAATQGALVEADIQQLMDNWFIETCDEWVVPYLGDLLGVRGLHAVPATAAFSQRARVANTLAYRRRKGTATMLEQLARDTTGWPARAVEFFQLLGWNQPHNHLRSGAVRTPDLRRTNELELLNTAFDSTMHTADVRRIAPDRGWYNLPNIGLFLWRLQSYFIGGGTARATTPGLYAFNPVALQDRPLFNRPQTETEITHLAEETNVPGALRRRPLYDELEACRAALLAGGTPRAVWFRAPQPVLRVFQATNAAAPFTFTEVPAHQIRICHLGAGAVRPAPADADGNAIVVGVDPVLGRLAWADTRPLPALVKVGYAYGFSGDLGGGPYDRNESVQAALALAPAVTWQVGVSKERTPVGGETIHPTLADAIADWQNQPAGTVGLITVMDSHTYAGDLALEISAGSRLFVVAADWPAQPKPGGGQQRLTGKFDATEVRPHLLGNLTVTGTAPVAGQSPGALVLDGLLIEGALTVNDPDHCLAEVRVAHCTLVPGSGGLSVNGSDARLSVQLVRSISGPVSIGAEAPTLALTDCIVDAGLTAAITAKANSVSVQSSTVLGEVSTRHLDAGNSIFTGVVEVLRRQDGCVRFCCLPPGSQTGRRYRCQPELAVEQAEADAEAQGRNFGPAEAAALTARIVPAFTALEFGAPAYAQLATACPAELRTGAEDGAELGAFRFLQQPQREANLRASLDEFLRFGLEAGLIFST
jgi:hypothetical protein